MSLGQGGGSALALGIPGAAGGSAIGEPRKSVRMSKRVSVRPGGPGAVPGANPFGGGGGGSMLLFILY